MSHSIRTFNIKSLNQNTIGECLLYCETINKSGLCIRLIDVHYTYIERCCTSSYYILDQTVANTNKTKYFGWSSENWNNST